MKHFIFAMGTFLFLASSAVAAENSYPPPPPAGKALSVEDTIYGVLRNHHNLRGMIENREVLTHEVRRAQAGFGPRVDVTGQAGGSVLSDSSTRSQNLDSQMWGKVGYSAQLVQPIWDGFATRSRVRTAKSTLESQKYRVFDTGHRFLLMRSSPILICCAAEKSTNFPKRMWPTTNLLWGRPRIAPALARTPPQT